MLWWRAGTVGAWTLGSRVLGLLRDRLLAGAFGASLGLDAFFIAFALPNLLRNLFGEGALATAFIPRYVSRRNDDPADANHFAGSVLARLTVFLSALALVGVGIAMVVATWGSPDARLVAVLAVPQVPYVVFICVAAILAGVLQARGHFWVPAAAPVLLNVVLIGAVLIWTDLLILPLAVLVAGLVQCAAHLIAARTQTDGLPPLAWTHDALPELKGALLPTVLAASIFQLNALLDYLIAFILVPTAGAVTVLYFGNRLLQFPLALVGHAVITAVYPDLAQAAKTGTYEDSGKALREASGLLAFWLLPATVGLFLVADPLVRTIYQTGAFSDPSAIARTVLVTRCFAFALVPIAVGKLLTRLFHAHLDQRTPVRVSLGMTGVNLVLNLVLVQTPLREAGLALATAISSAIGLLWSSVLLAKRGAGSPIEVRGLVRPALACTVMAGAVVGVLWWLPPEPGHGFGAHALRLLAGTGTGAVVYVAVAGPGQIKRALRGLRRGSGNAGQDVPAD